MEVSITNGSGVVQYFSGQGTHIVDIPYEGEKDVSTQKPQEGGQRKKKDESENKEEREEKVIWPKTKVEDEQRASD